MNVRSLVCVLLKRVDVAPDTAEPEAETIEEAG